MLNQIRKLANAEPFEPFSIELSSGRILKVPTRDHVWLMVPGASHIAVYDDNDAADHLSPLHIVAVRTLSTK